MKKYWTSFLLFLGVLALAACGQTTGQKESAASSADQRVTLTVIYPDKDPYEETVSFKSGATVLDVLEDQLTVKEENGMVTAIDGVSQDTAASVYWMYKVNGQMAEKGAAELTVKDGDRIEFYQEAYQ